MRGIPRSLQSILLAAALSAPALPALAASCNPLAIVDSLEITRLPSGRPATVVKIAGKPATMLLDTGGFISGITQDTAKSLNLVQTRTNRGLRAVNGALTDMLARLPTLEMGQRMRQENAEYYVLPNASSEFDGILGGEFFRQYDADFDFGEHRLNLFSQDHCEGNEVYWKSPIVAVIPFTLDQGNHIRFPMELDGKKLDVTLDTGAATTALNLNIAQRTFGIDVNAPDVQKVGAINGGFTANVYGKRFKTLAAGGVNITEPEIALVPDLVAGTSSQAPAAGSLISEKKGFPDMLLGMSIMNQLHVYIAYKEHKIYMTASNTAPPPPTAAPVARGPAAQNQTASFCPSPSDAQAGATPAPATPAVADGMTAFRQRNYTLAYANLKPLADMGNAEAARDLGTVLRQSCQGDKSAAAFWLRKAAEAGDVEGAAGLGNMLMFANGVPQDDQAAFKWLTQAANGGDTVAAANLGQLYFTGRGVAQDRYQGVVWWVRAGEKGGPIAIINIGREYANGQTLPKDYAKALYYMTIGIEHAPPGRRNEFQPALENIARQMSPADAGKVRQDARKWEPGQGKLAEVLADADKRRGQP